MITIAENAIVAPRFAFAIIVAPMHKKLAFQASSPKNFKATFAGGFFLFF
jgi:hypothetical protein